MLESKDILQINATVIAGLLILLTLATQSLGALTSINDVALPIRIAVLTIIPFSASSIIAVFHAYFEYSGKDRKNLLKVALFFMMAGFGYLVWGLLHVYYYGTEN